MASADEANAPMKCKFEVVPSQDCFDTDDEGNPKVGHALASGQIEGNEKLKVSARIQIERIVLDHRVEGEIALS